MRQRRREATAKDSNSPKLNRREGYLSTVQIQPAIFYMFCCASAEFFVSYCDSIEEASEKICASACIQEHWEPELVNTFGAAARYRRATVGSSHNESHPDNSTQHTG